MTLSWCWLAAALVLAGPARRGTGPARARRGLPLWASSTLTGAAAVVAPLAVLDPGPGLCVGTVVAPIAVVVVRRLQARTGVRLTAAQREDLPLLLDILAASLRSGQPLGTALGAAAPIARGPVAAELTQVAGLLRLGAEPLVAWRALRADPELTAIAQAACRSAESGIRLAAGFEQVATELRADAIAAARARAHRAGVWAMAPLGVCFLPAFVCLGVVPVVIGVAHGVLTGLGP